MSNVIKKMGNKMPCRFPGFNIFLSAIPTISPLNFSPAIEAVFFFSFFKMRQAIKILIKIILLPAMKHHLSLFLRHLFLPLTATLLVQYGTAQYYYHDMILISQNQQQLQAYKKNKITQVKLRSFEADGQPTEDFFCEVTPNSNYTQVNTITKSDLTGYSSQTAFYKADGQLYRSTDSSKETVNKYEYNYNADGRLTSVLNISGGLTNTMQQQEIHEWKYNDKGCPETMYRIKNTTDTTVVKFVCDSLGNVTEEESWYRGASKEKIYYYYDSLNRLTDVVRFHPRLARLLPDYMFEYNDKAQLIQMITVQQGGNDYIVWQYAYTENGLRTSERCLNKQRKPVGKITYQYISRSK